MSTFPSAAFVQLVQRLILETFEVSEKVANDYAAGLVALAEGWGAKKMQKGWIGNTESRSD